MSLQTATNCREEVSPRGPSGLGRDDGWLDHHPRLPAAQDTHQAEGRVAELAVAAVVGTQLHTHVEVTNGVAVKAVEILDDWRRNEPDVPGRPEAMRRLMHFGIAFDAERKFAVRSAAKKKR